MNRTTWLTRRSALERGAVAAGLVGVGTRPGAAQEGTSDPGDRCYYQVDFVAGEPIETLGTDESAFYGGQNRLIQYAHADGDEVVERDTWLNSLDPEIRECVTADPIEVRDGTVSVEFAVADGCERQFSLAVYPLPGGEFSFERRQALAAAATGTSGPGTHELAVEDVPEAVCPSVSLGRYEQVARLVADDADADDRFGFSVAVADPGGTAVVGADLDDDAAESAGSAYVFGRGDDGWTQRAKLVADDAARGDSFGAAVAVSDSGETAVVGAYQNDDTAGSAYVFGRGDDGWTQRAKLAADDAERGDFFGPSVAVSGSGGTAVVGSPLDDTAAGENAGSAYVFDRGDDGWTQRAKLTPDDAERGDWFGESVAVAEAGETAVVGAQSNSDAGRSSGSAYVFGRSDDGWTQRAKLAADDAAPVDHFGLSVAVSDSGETAVVGSPFDDTAAGENAGSAYVFDRGDDGWTQRAKLTATDAERGDFFGPSVAVSGSGDTVVVGADLDDTDAGELAGSAYVFGRDDDGWPQRAKLTPDDATERDRFGPSVAVSGSGGTVLVASPDDDTAAGEDAGSVYVFGR